MKQILSCLKMEDFPRFFSYQTIIRGKSYFNQHRVLRVYVNEMDYVITSVVQGKNNKQYQTHITIQPLPDAVKIISRCSCPVGFACKHVVATLIKVLNESNQNKHLPLQVNQLDYHARNWCIKFAEHLPLIKTSETMSQPQEVVLYLLSIDDRYHTSHYLTLKPFIARILKKGGLGKSKVFIPTTESKKNKLQPADEEIFAFLNFYTTSQHYNYQTYNLRGTKLTRLMQMLIESNRCFFQSLDNPPLQLGQSLIANICWVTQDNGYQKTCLDIELEKNLVILPLSPLWYVDAEKNIIGRVTGQMDDNFFAHLRAAPAFSPEEANAVHHFLSAKMQLSQVKIALPRTYSSIQKRLITPTVQVRIRYDVLPEQFVYESLYFDDCDKTPIIFAELSFKYGNNTVCVDDKLNIQFIEDNVLVQVQREWKFETKCIKHFHNMTKNPLNTEWFFDLLNEVGIFYIGDPTTELDNIVFFANQRIPELRELGWIVEFDDNFPYRSFNESDAWYVELEEKSVYQWFDLELGVLVDNKKINLLPHLIDFIKNTSLNNTKAYWNESTENGQSILPLSDGKNLILPHERMQKFLNLLLELYADNYSAVEAKLKISKSCAAQLFEFQQILSTDKTQWLGTEKLLSLGEKLKNMHELKTITPPKAFQASLRPYQQDGVNWLQFLREHQFNGILADDMGLGKTIQMLAHLSIEQHNKRLTKPTLIIAPTSVLINWRSEIERFAPKLKTLILHGQERKSKFNNINDYHIVLTTYPLLIRDVNNLLSQSFYYLVLDEAQYIKNDKAKMTKIVKQIPSDYRLCLTGTPLENHLGELWSLFDFLMPDLFGNIKLFNKKYRYPIEKLSDQAAQERLSKIVKPFLVRRKKTEVLQDLPEKTEIIHRIELTEKQRDLYESVRLAMHEKIKKVIDEKGINRSHIMILDALLKLRQICCDTRLLKLEAAKDIKASSKLEALIDMLKEMLDEGRKVLLFSQFTSMLALIEDALSKYGINYVKLTGSTKDRETPINQFQSGKVPLFLISLKAGGTGLNLTAADTVIHYDPWWNPAVENQATDRAHRIGQSKHVFVYKLVTVDTVEEKILIMQQKKQALFDNVLERNVSNVKITREDIDFLFANKS